jgi:hypothetical protein
MNQEESEFFAAEEKAFSQPRKVRFDVACFHIWN